LQEPLADGRAVLRGQFARGVHGPGQLAHEEVVVFAQVFDGGAHLTLSRRALRPPALTPGGGREQSGEEVQVLGPDVDGEPRPKVVEPLKHPARVAAV
jgi:hypothetical protein